MGFAGRVDIKSMGLMLGLERGKWRRASGECGRRGWLEGGTWNCWKYGQHVAECPDRHVEEKF